MPVFNGSIWLYTVRGRAVYIFIFPCVFLGFTADFRGASVFGCGGKKKKENKQRKQKKDRPPYVPPLALCSSFRSCARARLPAAPVPAPLLILSGFCHTKISLPFFN